MDAGIFTPRKKIVGVWQYIYFSSYSHPKMLERSRPFPWPFFCCEYQLPHTYQYTWHTGLWRDDQESSRPRGHHFREVDDLPVRLRALNGDISRSSGLLFAMLSLISDDINIGKEHIAGVVSYTISWYALVVTRRLQYALIRLLSLFVGSSKKLLIVFSRVQVNW